MAKQKKSVHLEVDSKLIENNLLLQTGSQQASDFENLFNFNANQSDDAPWKLVTPTPGFVVKTTNEEGKKIFINLCKADGIPEPKDLSDEELIALWQTDDITDYRVPLSMLDPHDELDKSGKVAVAYDVAVNGKFFDKLKDNEVYRSFVLQVVFEGLENKYDLKLKKEGYVILRNRNVMGTLKPHRIRSSQGPYQPPKRLIEEIGQSERQRLLGSSVGEEQNANNSRESVQHRLLHGNNILVGQFYLPKINTGQDINLDVGENRIIVETASQVQYGADVFLPHKVDESKAIAHFNQGNKILTVLMPCIVNG